MKANLLLKQNIDAILKRRGQTRRELAQYTLRTTDKKADSWISHIFGPKGYHTREIPTRYLDRIADFFGLDSYRLFQPGLSAVSERRSTKDRRSASDRRISATPRGLPSTPIRQIAVTPDDEAILADLHSLNYDDYQRVKGWISVARIAASGRKPGPRGGPGPSTPAPLTSTPPLIVPRSRRGKPEPKN